MSGEFAWQVDGDVGITDGAAGTRRRRVEVNAGCTARRRAGMSGEIAWQADEHAGNTAGAGKARRCRVKVNSRLHAQTEAAHER